MNLAANNLNENILMLNRVENESKKLIHYENFIEFLMHDLKKSSLDALPEIINYALEKGYEFKKIDKNTPIKHFKIAN